MRTQSCSVASIQISQAQMIFFGNEKRRIQWLNRSIVHKGTLVTLHINRTHLGSWCYKSVFLIGVVSWHNDLNMKNFINVNIVHGHLIQTQLNASGNTLHHHRCTEPFFPLICHPSVAGACRTTSMLLEIRTCNSNGSFAAAWASCSDRFGLKLVFNICISSYRHTNTMSMLTAVGPKLKMWSLNIHTCDFPTWCWWLAPPHGFYPESAPGQLQQDIFQQLWMVYMFDSLTTI